MRINQYDQICELLFELLRDVTFFGGTETLKKVFWD